MAMIKMRSTSFRLLLLLLVVALIRGDTRGDDNLGGEGSDVDIPVPPTNVIQHVIRPNVSPSILGSSVLIANRYYTEHDD